MDSSNAPDPLPNDDEILPAVNSPPPNLADNHFA